MFTENNISSIVMKNAVFLIGKVLRVDGRSVKVKVNKNKNLSHLIYQGDVVKNVTVGGYIKITKGFVEIIGKVEGEFVEEDFTGNSNYNIEEERIERTLNVSLYGHFEDGRFKQGIKELPLVDNNCYLLDKAEFNKLHQFYKENERIISIGSLADEPSANISLSVNKLFASHIGIFGNTGSGKSNTLTALFTELFKMKDDFKEFKKKSKFVIIDFNGEYTKEDIFVDSTKKNLYKLSTITKEGGDKYQIEISSLENLEILSILLNATEKTQVPFLSRAIKSSYFDDDYDDRIKLDIERKLKAMLSCQEDCRNLIIEYLENLKNFTKEKEAVDSIIYKIQANLHWNGMSSTFYYPKDNSTFVYANSDLDSVYNTIFGSLITNLGVTNDIITKIKFKIFSHYFHEVFKGYSNPEHIGPVFKRMFKTFDSLKKVLDSGGSEEINNIQIISLKNVNIEMKKILPLLICKELYEVQKNSIKEEKCDCSLHIIIDEAHNILSYDSQRESESWRDYRLETFEEIIKEGRKFGVFLTISSQRPHDISPTIVSQIHNYFIHRLINNRDIDAIEKSVAYLDKLSFETIPILSQGSCFIAGSVTDLPVKVQIKLLPEKNQPKSETINLVESWS